MEVMKLIEDIYEMTDVGSNVLHNLMRYITFISDTYININSITAQTFTFHYHISARSKSIPYFWKLHLSLAGTHFLLENIDLKISNPQ